MDGTIFSTTNWYQSDRTGLVMTSNEILTGTWCRKVAQQQIRAIGWSGYSLVSVPGAFREVGMDVWNPLTATVSLPDNAFGIDKPPMVYAFARYGSMVYYGQYQDDGGNLTSNPLFGKGVGDDAWNIDSEFIPNRVQYRTWIRDLHYDTVSAGTYRWSFTICHANSLYKDQDRTVMANLYYWFGAPHTSLFSYDIPTALKVNSWSNIALHWYVLGIDTGR
jgi:hypothetical protein